MWSGCKIHGMSFFPVLGGGVTLIPQRVTAVVALTASVTASPTCQRRHRRLQPKQVASAGDVAGAVKLDQQSDFIVKMNDTHSLAGKNSLKRK